MVVYCVLSGILIFLYIAGIKYSVPYDVVPAKRRFSLELLYPSVGFWLHKVKYFQSEAAKRKIEDYQTLHPGMNAGKIFYLESLRRFSMLYSMILLVSVLCIILQTTDSQIINKELRIRRPDPGTSAEEQKIHTILRENQKTTEEEFTVMVRPREYSDKELMELKEEAFAYVWKQVKGNNKSLNKVRSALNLITKIPNNPFQISWSLDESGLVNEDGTINNKKLGDKVVTAIRACLAYEKMEEYVDIPLAVYPYQWSWKERVKDSFEKMLQQTDEDSRTKSEFSISGKAGNVDVAYKKEKRNTAQKILFCGMFTCTGMWIYWEETIKKKRKKHDVVCSLAYPGIVYKLTLLLGAGMTLKGAWHRIIEDLGKERVEKKLEEGYVYEEMVITWNEMENGMSELEAYSRFGKRMKLRSYLRFSSFITQNMKKGTKGFLLQLETEAREAQEERKQLARKLGEEAGTKLLLPMILMLLIVLVIIMLPAFLSLSRGGL